MCDPDIRSPSAARAPRGTNAAFDPRMPPSASSGSRRRRLWELSAACHCPVVGVCLPVETLRRLVHKATGQTIAGDYALHVGVVSMCGTRNRVAEALQRELDRRCAAALCAFAPAKTTDAVAALWDEAAAAGDVAAALWAALTQARCDGVLEERICRDIHMIQHQAGASARADLRRLQALAEENGVLGRELARVQVRGTQWQAERIAESERLTRELMGLRAEVVEKEALVASLRERMAEATAGSAPPESRTEWTRRVAELSERNHALERQLAAERSANAANLAHGAASEAAVAAQPAGADAPEAVCATAPAAASLRLGERCVLCVGGRSGHVPLYREIVERHGGRFAHHDGGIEDNARRLGAHLSAADYVICQTGCLSHSAYWLVKDHCKRTGKRCVYLDKPGAGSFLRGISELPAVEPAASGAGSSGIGVAEAGRAALKDERAAPPASGPPAV